MPLKVKIIKVKPSLSSRIVEFMPWKHMFIKRIVKFCTRSPKITAAHLTFFMRFVNVALRHLKTNMRCAKFFIRFRYVSARFVNAKPWIVKFYARIVDANGQIALVRHPKFHFFRVSETHLALQITCEILPFSKWNRDLTIFNNE